MRSALARLVLALPLLAACGGSARPVATAGKTERTVTTAAKPPKAEPARRPKHRREPSPGSLPQTNRRPSSATAVFHTEMNALWAGVRTGSLRSAMPAFFPEAAYVQVKDIGNPRSDYTARLVGEYRLDLAAAHALLEPDPRSARLTAVDVPDRYAHWVPPGTCDNRVGYYELPNARLVYRQNGGLHSFGIASLISWRGVWYVVHLGAVVRAAAGGVVDAPSAGAGISTPSSTC